MVIWNAIAGHDLPAVCGGCRIEGGNRCTLPEGFRGGSHGADGSSGRW
ncbi:hypothetical protein [Coleofasciculus sp.]